MDALEISYLLKRACAHRLLGHVAQCREARLIHHEFVKRYQQLLLALRRARPEIWQVIASPAGERQSPVSPDGQLGNRRPTDATTCQEILA